MQSRLKCGFASCLDHVYYGKCRPIYPPTVVRYIAWHNERRQSVVMCPVTYRSRVGKISVKFGCNIGYVLVEYRSSVSGISVKYRWNIGSSVGGISAKCRWHIGKVSFVTVCTPVMCRWIWPLNCRYLAAARSSYMTLLPTSKTMLFLDNFYFTLNRLYELFKRARESWKACKRFELLLSSRSARCLAKACFWTIVRRTTLVLVKSVLLFDRCSIL